MIIPKIGSQPIETEDRTFRSEFPLIKQPTSFVTLFARAPSLDSSEKSRKFSFFEAQPFDRSKNTE